ncbi:MAG: phosphatase PAP2 family protein [Sedimentisphaerales bacterium]|nr:phosphatase PAP2 family protein [Sedimentisphaerales bacterium]
MKRVISLLLTRKEEFNKIWLYKLKMEMLSTLRTHTIFICIILLYLAGYLIFSRIYGAADKVSLFLYYKNVLILGFWCFLIFFIGHSIYVKFFIRPDNFMEYALNDLQTKYFNTERLCHLLLIAFSVPAFLSAFTSFKIILPMIHPFSWDLSLAKLDAFLHGGQQPWQLLQPVFGYPILTSILSVFYYLWFFVMYSVLFWQAFSLRDKQLRMQFFLTYLLSWIIIGTISAIIFSSAGPCYYGHFVKSGEDFFRPLMDYLYTANESFPIKSIDIQELLWSAYNGRETGLVKGISAMPSMHISMSFLFVLLGWRVSRIAGILFSLFALIIFIGSIHLGWHYAIDGYAAIILTTIIWLAVGFVLKRNDSFEKQSSEE